MFKICHVPINMKPVSLPPEKRHAAIAVDEDNNWHLLRICYVISSYMHISFNSHGNSVKYFITAIH